MGGMSAMIPIKGDEARTLGGGWDGGWLQRSVRGRVGGLFWVVLMNQLPL